MDHFDRSRCLACGECIERCPVIDATGDVSAGMVRDLSAGARVGAVLDRCTGCMSCDAFCAVGANPYGLLLEHYQRRYVAEGIPRVFCCAMPQRPGPNLWSCLDKWLTPREKQNLRRWAKPPSSEEVLFLGCNQRLTPYVADSPIFDGLQVFSDPEECCGEYYLRLGLIDKGREKAAALAARFESLGIKRVIAFCPACENTMRNLAPSVLGIDYPVEVTGLVDWIAAGLGEGRFGRVRSLDATVTVQDPCHASGIGEETIKEVRSVLGSLGLEVTEMAGAGLDAECCGLGASLARYNLADVIRTGIRRSRQARATGASSTCAWCNGCYMVMNMFRLIYPFQQPIYHLVELVEKATGVEPVRQVPSRSLQLLAAASEAALRDGLRFERVRV